MYSKRRIWVQRLAIGLVMPLALAGAAYLAAQASGAPKVAAVDPDDPTSIIEEGNVVYRFNAISGQEALFDRGADPHLRRDLGPSRLPELLHLRRRLLARERVETLEQIRARHTDVIARLRALGYM